MRKNGLTLVEAVIATAIAAVLAMLLPVIIVNTAGIFYKESSKVNIGLSINDALSQIRENVKESYGISSTYPPSGSPVYTSSSDVIVLKILSIDSQGSILDNTFDFFVYYKDDDKLRFKSFPDSLSTRLPADQILSNNLNSLVFQYFDSSTPPVEVVSQTATKVKITLSLKQKSTAGNYEQIISTSEASLRND